MTFVTANSYLVIPWSLASTTRSLHPARVCVALVVYVMGMYLKFVSDAQLMTTLKFRKGLVTEALFCRTRNPSYFGEILLYIGYLLIAKAWIGWFVCLAWWLLVFTPNIRSKDKSLSRYEAFKAYSKEAWVLIPNPFPLPKLI